MHTDLKLKDIINTLNFTYEKLDTILYKHNNEVTYLTFELCNNLFINDELKFNLIIASYLHNITLYTSKSNYCLNTTNNTFPSEDSILSYILIETLIPSNTFSKYILYYNSKFKSSFKINNIDIPEECNILKIANDIASFKFKNKDTKSSDIINFLKENIDSYNPDYINVLFSSAGNNIISKFLNNKFESELNNFNSKINLLNIDLLEFINAIAFLVDFKYDIANIHSLSVSQCSLLLCEYFNLNLVETEEVLIGSLLHDIGKLITPDSILKKPGKLTYNEFSIMKCHVLYTYEILKHLNNEKILNIASNHHEKLNGTGYPNGISNLSLQERIVAVADIFVALNEKRFYKDSFTREKTIEILLEAVNKNEIDSLVVNKLIENYDCFINMNINLSLKYNNLIGKLDKEFWRLYPIK